LSGVAIIVDEDRPLVTEVGQYVRVFVKEVGFVPGRIVRQSNSFIAVEFDLAQSLERDLLIGKLFTLGLNTATDVGSAPAATVAILGSIVSVRTNNPQVEVQEIPSPSVKRLGAESLVLRPSKQVPPWKDIRARRRSFPFHDLGSIRVVRR
jgi:cellulose synthase (UDP-forming)